MLSVINLTAKMRKEVFVLLRQASVITGLGCSIGFLNRLLLVHNKGKDKMTDSPPPEVYPQDRVRNMSIFIGDMRIPYMNPDDAFTEDQLVNKEPYAQFNNWFEKAAQTEGIEEPNAMCLATATKEGRPSARMVLLKGYGPEGFKFFTNYTSRKANELVSVENICFICENYLVNETNLAIVSRLRIRTHP